MCGRLAGVALPAAGVGTHPATLPYGFAGLGPGASGHRVEDGQC